MQKLARVKGPRKRKGKGHEQNSGNREKKSIFGLLRMTQIKIFYVSVPNLGDIYRFGEKIAKLRPSSVMAAKILMYFWVKILQSKG